MPARMSVYKQTYRKPKCNLVICLQVKTLQAKILANKSLENVLRSKYFRTTVTNQNFIHQEIMNKLNLENACCHAVHNPLFHRLLPKNIGIKMAFFFSKYYIMVIESNRVRSARYAALIKGEKNVQTLLRKTETNRPSGRYRRRRKDIIKLDPEEILWQWFDSILLLKLGTGCGLF